uniref:DUF1616 domain-containing protein n=1 Tax=uncultured Methanobacterium sp. TaxID=176306 RepID=UPI002AA7988E
MKLSSQKDLLLIIILSIAVLLMSWLKLIKGYPLSLLPTILVLFLPGYALITAIWPSDEKMGWTLRLGMGFVLGLVFILFLPLIFNSLNWTELTGSINQILLIVAIVFSLIAMARRTEPVDELEPLHRDPQLTLEESIERATLMRQKAEEEPNEYEDHYEGDEEYYDNEYYEEEPPEGEDNHKGYYSEYDEGLDDETHGEPEEESSKEFEEETGEEPEDEFGEAPDIEPRKYQDLKNEKPLQYERIKDKYPLDEDEYHPDDSEYHRAEDQSYSDDEYVTDYHESPQDEEDHPKQTRGVPLRVEEPVKTSPTDYEAEMDKPVWGEEPPKKKTGFKNWDLVMILFLSGISLLFLYFNPLKTTTTSVIFFILLLFILGYAGLTIIFPAKSRASSRNLLIASTIIAVILFILSFLAWNTHLLPSVPKYVVTIMFVASIILVAGAF